MNQSHKYLIRINNLLHKSKSLKMDNSQQIDKDEILRLIDGLRNAILYECDFKEKDDN